eukprot:COSAG01_NODE_60097_length_296_cov_1.142132_1_plen_50_part_10
MERAPIISGHRLGGVHRQTAGWWLCALAQWRGICDLCVQHAHAMPTMAGA